MSFWIKVHVHREGGITAYTYRSDKYGDPEKLTQRPEADGSTVSQCLRALAAKIAKNPKAEV